MRESWNILKETVKSWISDEAPMKAAALSFYSILSLAPLLVIVVAVAGFVYGRVLMQSANGQAAASQQLVSQIQQWVGPQGAQAVQTVLAKAQLSHGSRLATLLAIIMSIVGAAGLFTHLQVMLNQIWNVKDKTPQKIVFTILKRLLTFLMVLLIGFLLLAAMAASAILTGLGSRIGNAMPGMDIVWQVVNFVASFLIITVLFALLFKVLPDAKVVWRDVWIGAAVTALLFTIGKLILGIYLGHSSTASVYGAAGSLVVLLLWIYYSAQILFFGAEFTQVYARHRGRHIVPSQNAQPLHA